MGDAIRLDRVFVFADQLSFLIPHDWVKGEAEHDHYLYHAPDTDSGWLRVSLVSLKVKDQPPSERLDRLYKKWRQEHGDAVYVEEETQNVVRVRENDSVEAGSGAYVYYWYVANSSMPDLVHEAVFTFTILKKRIEESKTKDMVALIWNLVTHAQFSQPARTN